MTWYDFVIAGFFVNVAENPKNKGAAAWAKAMPEIPERVKQYLADFNTEMADYLANRPDSMIGA